MKFSAVKENIFTYIQYANSFTSPKNLNPLLQNIHLCVEANSLTMKATNYQVGFSCTIDVDVKETGALTVSGKTLMEIIKEMPDGALIDFFYDGSRLNIKSGKASFKLSTMSVEGFPTISDINSEYYLKIDAKEFLTLLKRIWFCISNESQKIEYTGAQFNVSGNTLEMFATGLQRVAIASTVFDKEFSDEFMINIPKKTIVELIRILEGQEIIEIETDKRQISFKTGNMIIYSKLIEKFVKGISRLFNNEYPVKAKLDRKQFIDASRRVSSITNPDTPGIALNFENSKLTMSSIQSDYGQGQEILEDIEYKGEPFDIILNSKHVNEILSNIETEYFTLEMADKRSPALITPESVRYRYLVVPISIDKIS